MAATYDSSSVDNNPKLYIDGKESVVRVQTPPVGDQTSLLGTAFLGDRADGTRGYDGLIDEVRVYNRELSGGEIASLAAKHYEARWSRYSIRINPDRLFPEPFEFSLVDKDGVLPSADIQWIVLSDEGSHLIESPEAGSTLIFIEGTEEALVVAKASDDMATEYFVTQLSLIPPSFEAGFWMGESESGTIVFVEILESLDSGYVTLYDPESGFYKISEEIAVSPSGEFQSVDNSADAISGVVGDALAVWVPNQDLDVSGALITVSGPLSAFNGEYSGGLLDRDGEYLDIRILGDGDIWVVRHGKSPDLGAGKVNAEGEFSITTSNGLSFSGKVREDLSAIDGIVESESETFSFYLRRVGVSGDGRFVNLSTRGFVEGGEGVLIGGFVVKGSEERNVLIRAVGPGLASEFGIAGSLEDPFLSIFRSLDGGSEELDSNSDWGIDGDEATLAAKFRGLGAFPLVSGSLDAAKAIRLTPGEYTAVVSGAPGQTGEALFEVYDGSSDGEASFVNVSTRGRVEGDSKLLIGGFVVDGPDPKKVLLRAIGPSLADFDVVNALGDPNLELYRGSERIGGNDNWMDGEFLRSGIGVLESAFLDSGAFPLASDSLDSALLVWLQPGEYTIVVSGVEGGSGVALVEAYELP